MSDDIPEQCVEHSPVDVVEVPASALINCPKRGFALRAVRRCVVCDKFDGFVRMADGATRVACAQPIARKIITVEAD